MNVYIYVENNEVGSFVNEEDPVFPGIPIEQRYSREFLDKCVVRTEEQIEAEGIHSGMLYDPETDTFYEHPEPETPEEPEEPEETFSISQEEADNAYVEGVNSVE